MKTNESAPLPAEQVPTIHPKAYELMLRMAILREEIIDYIKEEDDACYEHAIMETDSHTSDLMHNLQSIASEIIVSDINKLAKKLKSRRG